MQILTCRKDGFAGMRKWFNSLIKTRQALSEGEHADQMNVILSTESKDFCPAKGGNVATMHAATQPEELPYIHPAIAFPA